MTSLCACLSRLAKAIKILTAGPEPRFGGAFAQYVGVHQPPVGRGGVHAQKSDIPVLYSILKRGQKADLGSRRFLYVPGEIHGHFVNTCRFLCAGHWCYNIQQHVEATE